MGQKAKDLPEAIEHHYPNTFKEVQIRVNPNWLAILGYFHAIFMRTSSGALTKKKITILQVDLKELEGLKFNPRGPSRD